MREVRLRFEGEIEKLSDYITKIEADNHSLQQSIKILEGDRHRVDLRLVEVGETLKTERVTYEQTLATLNKEKELESQKIADDLAQLRLELTRAEQINQQL